MFPHGRRVTTVAEMVDKDRLQMVCDDLLRVHLILRCRLWENKHFVFLHFIFIFNFYISTELYSNDSYRELEYT